MLKSYSQLSTLPPLVKLARNMGASLCVLRVSLLVWKKSMLGCTPSSSLLQLSILMQCFIGNCVQTDNCFLQGEDSRDFEELAWEEYSSHCCHRWGADFGARRSWLSGRHYQEFDIKDTCWLSCEICFIEVWDWLEDWSFTPLSLSLIWRSQLMEIYEMLPGDGNTSGKTFFIYCTWGNSSISGKYPHNQWYSFLTLLIQ
jgi:hypothetical protein